MGTQSDEQPMGDIEILVQQSLNYTEIIHEYCTLASQRSLTQLQADRLEQTATVVDKPTAQPNPDVATPVAAAVATSSEEPKEVTTASDA